MTLDQATIERHRAAAGMGEKRCHSDTVSDDLVRFAEQLEREGEDPDGPALDLYVPDGEIVPAPGQFKPEPATELVKRCPELRPVLIGGLLRFGETLNLISVTKIGKSWLTLNLVLAIALGLPWLGRWCRRGRVLLVDNELHPETLAYRIRTVAQALEVDVPDNLDVIAARGRPGFDIHSLERHLAELEPGYYVAVCIDALYRAVPLDIDENSNRGMTDVYNTIDRMADSTGAGFVGVHHSSKGAQNEKRVTDVGSGAGAISRATDSHVVLREHEEQDVYVFDAAVRSFESPKPQCFRRVFPLFVPADELDPSAMKSAKPSKGESTAARDERVYGELQRGEPRTARTLRSELTMNGDHMRDSLTRLQTQGLAVATDPKTGEQFTTFPEGIRGVLWSASENGTDGSDP